jgi:hypothetical protein
VSTLLDSLGIVEAAKQELDEAVGLVLKQIQNVEGESLDERWKAYVKIHELLPAETYGDGFIEDINTRWTIYDDFYIERHETVDYPTMYQRIKDMLGVKQSEALDMWRERVLATGDGSFTYDW